METALIHPTMAAVPTCFEHSLSSMSEPRWYAAYTSAHHEKKVAAELTRLRVESFLPLYTSLRRWRDRRVQLELPLFPSYIFVYLPLVERLRVLRVPGVVRLVGFSGTPVPLPDSEIARIHSILQYQFRPEPHPHLTAGKRVRVKTGPLAGWEGTITSRKNRNRFVVTVALIQRSVAIEIDGLDVEPSN